MTQLFDFLVQPRRSTRGRVFGFLFPPCRGQEQLSYCNEPMEDEVSLFVDVSVEPPLLIIELMLLCP